MIPSQKVPPALSKGRAKYSLFEWRNELCLTTSIWPSVCLMTFGGMDFPPLRCGLVTTLCMAMHVKNLMKTDVRETENSYELDIDLPGFQKEEMTVELRDGYLSIRAAKGLDKEERTKKALIFVRSVIPAHAAAASTLVMWSLRRCPLSMKTVS